MDGAPNRKDESRNQTAKPVTPKKTWMRVGFRHLSSSAEGLTFAEIQHTTAKC